MTIYKSTDGEQAVKQCYNEVLKLWPVTFEQLTLPTCHGETHVLACGGKALPPLLLMHGAMANATAWFEDIEAWSQHFRVYALDIIGEPGLSEQVRLPMNSDAYTLWLDDAMQALALPSAAIIGESLGAWLALDYASRRPEKVTQLALLVPAGVGPQRRFLLKAIPLLLLGQWGRGKVQEMIFGPTEQNPSPTQLKFREFFTLIAQHVSPRLDKLPIFNNKALQSITAPTLAIIAGKDVLLNSKVTQKRLKANLNDVKVIYQTNARHLIRDRSEILTFLLNTNNKG